MTMKDCIDEAVAAGEMDAARAAEAKGLFDELEAELRASMGPESAAATAARETYERLQAEMTERARQKLLSAMTQRRILADLAAADDMAEAAMRLIDASGGVGRSNAAEQIRKVVRGRAHARMNEVLATFRRNLVGQVRNKARLVNLVREAFGEQTGDVAAKELAGAWRSAAEYLRRQFNDAGGHIGWREDWGLPQAHDAVKVRRATYEEWRDYVLPRLDPARMMDGATGKPFTAARLEMALKDVYEAIRTEGFSKITPSSGGGGKALANRRADPRFLVFRSADDWLAYQDRFGAGDPFSAMMSHVDAMSRDIGALRALGPNPQASLRFVQQHLKKAAREKSYPDAAAQDKAINRADRAARHLDVLYSHYSGSVNSPGDAIVARGFASTRQVIVSAVLGSAAISAISDAAFQRLTRGFVGLPQGRVLQGYAKMLFSKEDRRLAIRAGLIAEEWSTMAAAQARYTGEVISSEVAARLSDFTLRASGLSAMTQAGRWAFGMEFLGALADYAGHAFADLPKPLAATLKRHGIGQDSWDIIRATPLHEHRGATFLMPEDLAGRTDISPRQADDLTTRLLAMVQAETEYAVPSTSIRGRAMLGDNTRPGTVPGEIIRSGLMFKNFAITMAYTHLRRIAGMEGGWNKARYTANLVISTTLMGALAVQLKDIVNGKDPRDMTTPAFWGQAMLQGGGLGIFGDFLASENNRFGGGLAETVAGPIVGAAGDALRLTAGNVFEAAQGKETKAAKEAVDFADRYLPGGSIWYARLTLDRLVFDQLRRLADPDYAANTRRLQNRLRRENGQEFFWYPGEPAPDRAPDLSTAAGSGR